jgi:thiamine transport system substrate-binding protein
MTTNYPRQLSTLSSLLSVLLISACSSLSAAPKTLTVMTHDSFAVSDSVIAAYQQAEDVKVTFVKGGDAGAMLNKAILSKDAPLADVLYGVDNTLLSRAISAGIYEPYASPALKNIPAQFQLDSTNNALPVDFGDVCVVYDKAYFTSHNLTPPQTLEDLTRPAYKGLLVMENPATSSTGLDFLLATVKHYGDPNYLGYWKDLRANGVVIVDGWETAYYTNFSGSSGKGSQPLVVSYGTDPAADVMSAQTPPPDSNLGVVSGPDACFRQVEFVGILKGTQQRALSESFVDFMLGAQFQADLPGQMYVYPVLAGVSLPEAFTKFAVVPSQPAALDPAEITAHRDAWIQAWTDAVLH